MTKKMTKIKNTKENIWQLFVVSCFFMVVDQISKFFAIRFLHVSLNEGVAFGVKIGKFFIIALTALLIVFLLRVVLDELNLKKWSAKFTAGAILGGAVGNLIDRLYLGNVIDFISVPYWPTFNLADVFIVTGVAFGVIFYKRINK